MFGGVAVPRSGADTATAFAVSTFVRPKRWPARRPIRATSATAAMPHGRPDVKLRSAAARSPAGVPQRWQNFAPGVSDAPHDAHVAPTNGVPQFEQNFPTAATPHVGQRLSTADSGAG